MIQRSLGAVYVPSFQTTPLMVLSIGDDNFSVIGICLARVLRKSRIILPWHTNSAHAPLNRDDGGLLPDAYLHLINR